MAGERERSGRSGGSWGSERRIDFEAASNLIVAEEFRSTPLPYQVAHYGAAEKQVGLSAAQLLVLQRLASGASPSLNELSQQTQTHQSSTSVVVSKLVSRGFVARQRAKGDARRLELTLTPRAKSMVRKTPHAAQDRLVTALGTMSKAEVKQLAVLLKKFIASASLESQEEE